MNEKKKNYEEFKLQKEKILKILGAIQENEELTEAIKTLKGKTTSFLDRGEAVQEMG